MSSNEAVGTDFLAHLAVFSACWFLHLTHHFSYTISLKSPTSLQLCRQNMLEKSGTNQDSQFQLSFNPYRRKCQKQAEGSAQIRDRQQSGTASLSLLLNMRTHTAHIPTGLPLHLHSQMVSPHNAALQTPQLVRSIKHKVPTIRGRFTPYMKLPRCRDS